PALLCVSQSELLGSSRSASAAGYLWSSRRWEMRSISAKRAQGRKDGGEGLGLSVPLRIHLVVANRLSAVAGNQGAQHCFAYILANEAARAIGKGHAKAVMKWSGEVRQRSVGIIGQSFGHGPGNRFASFNNEKRSGCAVGDARQSISLG